MTTIPPEPRGRRWGSCELSGTPGAGKVPPRDLGGSSVDFHLTRSLRLHTKPEHKNLYKWAINEIDAKGHQIGSDQIPWPWTLDFTAASCVLGDSIEIKSKTAPASREISQRQVIRVRLRPGSLRDREATFSMFGTDRSIQRFQLQIHPIDDPAEQERCKAWGSVSYTTEIDFEKETTDDCIIFYMFVKADTFDRYAAKIANGLVDEMVLRVGSVDGFYSEWSPLISTNRVKVLAPGSEQNITLPAGLQFEPPRLGDVGDVELYINRRLEFAEPEAPDAVEETADVGTVRVVPETRAPAAVEPRTLQMLGSLRRAAWFVVFLLALISIATLLQR
jgi:hypothetical protein